MVPKPHSLKSDKQSEINFWKKVDKSGECWEWTASSTDAGYGFFWPVGSKRWIGAHRYSYFLEHGQFDQTKQVCHRCDNPSCVNPNHLFLGTVRDNALDASKKGRLKLNYCRSGKHELIGEAIRTDSDGKRRCRRCQNELSMRRYNKNRASINARRKVHKSESC